MTRRELRRGIDRTLDAVAVAVLTVVFLLAGDAAADATDICGPAVDGYNPARLPCPTHTPSLAMTGGLSPGDVLLVFLFSLTVATLVVHVGRWLRAR